MSHIYSKTFPKFLSVNTVKYILLIAGISYFSPEIIAQAGGPANVYPKEVKLQIDSLRAVLSTNAHDTSKAFAYVGLAELLYVADIDILKNLCEKAKSIAELNLKKTSLTAAERIAFKTALAGAFNNIGYVYDIKGSISKALENYHHALKLQQEIGAKEGIASSLNSIAYLYVNQGDSTRALEYYHKSLKIEEALGSKQRMATSLTNIGAIYGDQNDISLALEYYHRSLKMYEEIGYKEGMASSLNNIGVIYSGEGDSTLALEYYNKAVAIKEGLGDKKGVAHSLNSIGHMYKSHGNNARALLYYNKSLKIREQIDDRQGIAVSLTNIGEISLEQGEVSESKVMAKKSLELAKVLGSPAIIRNASKLLSEVLKEEDNYEEALKMHELYIMMRDSVLNQEIKNATLKQEAQFQIAQGEAKIKLLDKEKQIIAARVTYQRNLAIGAGFGVLVLILFLWRLSINNARLKLGARTLEASNKTIGMQKDQAEAHLTNLQDENTNLEEKLENLREPGNNILTMNSSGLRLDVDKIYCVESQNRYLLITYHADRIESIYERTSLKDFIQQLPTNFVQIHRSYCINTAHIKSRVSKYKLIMKDDQLLPISQSYVDDLDKALKQV